MRVAGYIIGGLGILFWLALLVLYLWWSASFPALDPPARTALLVMPVLGTLFSFGLVNWGRAGTHGVLFTLASLLMIAAMAAAALFLVLPGFLSLAVLLMRDM